MTTSRTGIGLSFLVLLIFSTVASAQQHTKPADDHVTITRRTIAIVRTGEIAKAFPHRLKATVSYPVISGLRNPEILRKVLAILEFKNIFDTTLDEYRESAWLEEFDYAVNYNQKYILDLTFREEGTAVFPDRHYRHFTIDLRRGDVVKGAEVFAADKMDELAGLVNATLQQELKSLWPVILDLGRITEKNLRDLHDALKFEVENLNDFEVTSNGIVFLYDAGFPHILRAVEPKGRYRFSYTQLKPYLKPDGVLWQFVG